jgi:DNA-binding NarL/FixJ family response regulator
MTYTGPDVVPPRTIRVFVLNDHYMFVQVLGHYLRDFKDIHVVGTGLRGPDAYANIAKLQPDIVVVDPGPRVSDIAPTTTRLREAAPDAAIIGLAQSYDEEYPDIALRAGIELYIEKMAAAEELVSAIRGMKLRQLVTQPPASLSGSDGAGPD